MSDPVKITACPKCGASRGSPCDTKPPQSKVRRIPHNARRKKARRLLAEIAEQA